MGKNLRDSALKILKEGRGLTAYYELKKMPISTDRVGKAFVTSKSKMK